MAHDSDGDSDRPHKHRDYRKEPPIPFSGGRPAGSLFVDDNGAPLIFHLYRAIYSKERPKTYWKTLIERYGGEVTDDPGDPKVFAKIAPAEFSSYATNLVSVHFIEDSIATMQVGNLDDFRIPPRGATQTTQSTTSVVMAPAKKKATGPITKRNSFTAEDDKILVDYVRAAAAGGQTNWSGNELYKALEHKYPSHPWQSWRNRFINHFASALREELLATADAAIRRNSSTASGSKAVIKRPQPKSPQRPEHRAETERTNRPRKSSSEPADAPAAVKADPPTQISNQPAEGGRRQGKKGAEVYRSTSVESLGTDISDASAVIPSDKESLFGSDEEDDSELVDEGDLEDADSPVKRKRKRKQPGAFKHPRRINRPRTEFTEADVLFILQELARHEGNIGGIKLYQSMAEKNTRHTAESYQNHVKRVIAPHWDEYDWDAVKSGTFKLEDGPPHPSSSRARRLGPVTPPRRPLPPQLQNRDGQIPIEHAFDKQQEPQQSPTRKRRHRTSDDEEDDSRNKIKRSKHSDKDPPLEGNVSHYAKEDRRTR
ncbi:hypothetical protein M427DRAFT_415433 [Gonapodya prolifera JEL478]|uniref:DNA-binding protein RAP1 n=1 Tax=Gonapodya prolifera (strain JEL478) TaxID=1344416 RepID=A0A139A560_GONPJ|nr:hypothetical protein M427DRAFT_415433 [Gonapodya prolifera JEL478]|eukprot:KXS11871.1 hypothetical protein M427DRAFT_415433 [Gonapodya prolifera JEL478]